MYSSTIPDVRSTSTTPRTFTFSAETCLRLLTKLTEDEVNSEYEYMRSHFPDDPRQEDSRVGKVEALRKMLTRTLGDQFRLSVANLNSLASSITTTLDRTKECAEDILRRAEDILDTTTSADMDSRHAVAGNVSPPLECPVRVLNDVQFDVSVADIKNVVDFKTTHPGGRRTAYYGPMPYSYGESPRSRHSAMQYPDTAIFNDIFDKLNQHGVTRETHSILCTLYENGHVGIPLHQDNEPTIEKGSTIFTISFGATRQLKTYNTEGALKEFVIPLVHGSVHTMSQDSQSQWRHGIDREPDVTEPRVSFTIRKLKTEDATPLTSHNQSNIPPIAPPPPVQAKKRTSRVMLITDSLHKATPEHVFEQVPGHTCVKKECYELTDIFQFEPEFKFAKTVIMSCGVNDLSRYGKTANSLADMVCRRLEESCERHKKLILSLTA